MRIFTSIPIFHRTVAEIITKSSPPRKFSRGEINAICTNSRIAENGDLFFSFEKDRDKAISHIREATVKGAITVSEIPYESTITVKSVKEAFLDLAAFYKELLPIKRTIAITGSNGKTTTKDIAAKLISSVYNTHSTKGNFNNEIGVPITIFTAPRDVEILIAEAGMNHKGELKRISDCLRPDISVITNIGSAHIGNFGSREKIAEAKLEILSGMEPPFLIADVGEALLSSHRSLSVSYNGENADFKLKTKAFNKDCAVFDFVSKPMNIKDLTVKGAGAHIPSALAFSLSLSALLGIDEADIRDKLSDIRGAMVRSSVNRIGYLTVIDDTYNSSPEAVACALKTLALYRDHRISAVLGDMLELGENSEKYHTDVGKLCSDIGLTRLYTFGKYARVIADGAIKGGMSAEDISVNEDIFAPEITANEIISAAKPGDVILFKASNAVGLDRIINIIRKDLI